MIFIVFITCTSCQKSAILHQKEEHSETSNHAMTGQIVFTDGYVPFENFTAANSVSNFDLSESSNLNMRIILDKPLTNHMQALASELSVDQLCQQGNYLFRFYVDGAMVYEEQLNTGAGLCEQKTNRTTFSVPLASTENEDSWGRYLWMRFLFRGGGDAALSKGNTHILKIEARPYVNNPNVKIGDIIAEGHVQLNVIKPVATQKDIDVQPIANGSGWELSIDRIDVSKIEALNKKIAEREFRNIKSIVVIKNSKLLLEEYFNGADRSTQHDVRSVGKTFASTMMGVAIDDGYLKSENQTLSEFYKLESFENYGPTKDEVTLKSLLTMSSGFDGNDSDYESPGNEEYMYPTDDWVKFALDLQMDEQKKIGEDWAYFTAGCVVLGDVIDKAVPNGLAKYADATLFQPLGITDYTWPKTPTNVPNTAGGIRLRSLDFAKYGQLYKNGGSWENQQILNKDWVEKSLSRHIKRSPEEEGYYGYLFWNDVISVNGKSYEVSYCTGNGGNKIFIFKDIPYVIIVTATAYNRPYAHPQVDRMMEEFILPAVLD